jgi:hypothetical protein
MTVRQLKDFLDQLSDDAQVLIETDKEVFITACQAQSEIIDLCLDDIPDDEVSDSDIQPALVLRPCTCHTEGEVIPQMDALIMN